MKVFFVFVCGTFVKKRVVCHVCPIDCESYKRRSLNTIQTFYYINLKASPTVTSIKNKEKKNLVFFFPSKILYKKTP